MNFSARYLSVKNNNTRYSNSEFRHYLCLYSSYTKPPIGKSLIFFYLHAIIWLSIYFLTQIFPPLSYSLSIFLSYSDFFISLSSMYFLFFFIMSVFFISPLFFCIVKLNDYFIFTLTYKLLCITCTMKLPCIECMIKNSVPPLEETK